MVEHDANNCALVWFKKINIVSPKENKGFEDVLIWVVTYLEAAIGVLESFHFFIGRFKQ